MRSKTVVTDRLLADVAIPPGEHLADTLRELAMSQSELARRMDRPVQAINQIVNGSKAITAETALQIEAVTGVPAHVWARLEADYRLVVARLRTKSLAPAAAHPVVAGFMGPRPRAGYARVRSAGRRLPKKRRRRGRGGRRSIL